MNQLRTRAAGNLLQLRSLKIVYDHLGRFRLRLGPGLRNAHFPRNDQVGISYRRRRQQLGVCDLRLRFRHRLRFAAGQWHHRRQVIARLYLQLLRKQQTDIHEQQNESQFDPIAGGKGLPADPFIRKKAELWSAIIRGHAIAPIWEPGRGDCAGGSLTVGEMAGGVNVSAAGVPW